MTLYVVKKIYAFTHDVSANYMCCRPKNWLREHPVLGMNFAFWVIVHGVADDAFKGLPTVADVLAAEPPEGRESWTLEWSDKAKDLPFFRMVTLEGPHTTRALTFSSLHHNFTSLAQRDCFKDQLRLHGIRVVLRI